MGKMTERAKLKQLNERNLKEKMMERERAKEQKDKIALQHIDMWYQRHFGKCKLSMLSTKDSRSFYGDSLNEAEVTLRARCNIPKEYIQVKSKYHRNTYVAHNEQSDIAIMCIPIDVYPSIFRQVFIYDVLLEFDRCNKLYYWQGEWQKWQKSMQQLQNLTDVCERRKSSAITKLYRKVPVKPKDISEYPYIRYKVAEDLKTIDQIQSCTPFWFDFIKVDRYDENMLQIQCTGKQNCSRLLDINNYPTMEQRDEMKLRRKLRCRAFVPTHRKRYHHKMRNYQEKKYVFNSKEFKGVMKKFYNK